MPIITHNYISTSMFFHPSVICQKTLPAQQKIIICCMSQINSASLVKCSGNLQNVYVMMIHILTFTNTAYYNPQTRHICP